MAKPKSYLTNRSILEEIDKSKRSFASSLDPAFYDYDAIVQNLDQITPEFMEQIRAKKARPRGGEKVCPTTIDPESIVIRVMTQEHVPLAVTATGKKKVGEPVRTGFPPYKHYVIRDGKPQEVARSHWVGGFDNGHFSTTHGKPTDKLAMMWMLLVERYGRRPNFRGYSYLEDMKGNALVQLAQVGLQFDESKSDNPFAFYTTVARNAFVKILNQEKKTQVIRDDLIEIAGMTPSFSRQYRDTPS